MDTKSMNEVIGKIKALDLEESFDMIVAIANGGIIPAALLNQHLGIPVELLKINFRNIYQKPIYEAPKLLEDIRFNCAGKRILLVEDRVKTGATLAFARQLLGEALLVKTFAVNGKADYALYDEPCFKFPWLL